jgi:hypothetical protein
MASIRLGRYEAADGDLPEVCIVCGAPGDVYRLKNFSWHPKWVYFFILLGLLPLVIIALILTKRMSVRAPVCRDHRYHWIWRSWVIGGSLVLLIALFFVAMVIGSSLERRANGGDFFGVICGGFVALGIVWLIAAVAVQSTAVRATEITDREITLAGVSPKFVEAVLERDAEEEDDEEERRERERLRRRRLHDAELARDLDEEAPPVRRSDHFKEKDG